MGKAPPRMWTDLEIRKARLALKSQGSLHFAGVADKFRFPAELTEGVPPILRGSGVATGLKTSFCKTDIFDLCKEHNYAQRRLWPSGLEPLKDEPKHGKQKGRKRRRRQKKAVEEIMEMMTEKSPPAPRQFKYPKDQAAAVLRAAKKALLAVTVFSDVSPPVVKQSNSPGLRRTNSCPVATKQCA
eukprot:TRINITY_DN30306_c0_g1_i2.p1 TRINITY_DN30306_c0_g1~~TRINITY_DN30306_c0_g1_i2.p1  ORF type:complete len:185 (-),score=36.70 TRINITY_DN30306_c0_g1_i2:5-559(-)